MEMEQFTGFPEILGGRVKTLHPKVHGGLLFVRNDPDHQQQVETNQIEPIDLVVVNLYPFEATINKPEVKLEEAIEKIDIGGPSMLRSAAQNYRFVTVVTDPADYSLGLEELDPHHGETTLALRAQLALQVFLTTPPYATLIASYLNRE